MIVLVEPSLVYIDKLKDFKQEFIDAGEVIHGGANLEKFDDMSAWIAYTRNMKCKDTVEKGLVPSTVFIALRESDERIVGIIDIRHELNDYLLNYGGHVGYSIRKSERQKGYAKAMLKCGLDYCKAVEIDRVLLIASENNVPSYKTIEGCGGMLENKIQDDDDVSRRYWIMDLQR